MVFEFSHIREGWDPERGKFAPRPFDLRGFKRELFAWQDLTRHDGWTSLFLSNYDLTRQVSFYADDGPFRREAAKMLATVLHLLKGTPFIYQGEEIGMTNAPFDRIDQYRDLETLNHFEAQIATGVPLEEFIAGARRNSRDNSRTPMQWSAGPQAGFTTGTPWIEVNPDASEINVEQDSAQPDGVLAPYRKLVGLRRKRDIVAFGETESFLESSPSIMAYQRRLGEQRLVVLGNFTGQEQEFELPDGIEGAGACLVASHSERHHLPRQLRLTPYESLAVLIG